MTAPETAPAPPLAGAGQGGVRAGGGGSAAPDPQRLALERILRRVRKLPTLPDVASRLLAMMQDPETDAGDYEAVLRTDPGLVSHLLRLANSAIFGSSRDIASVRQAITFLGDKRLFDLVASVSFATLLPDRIPGYELEARAVWRHALAVALLGERIAGELGLGRPDRLFTAGLLHDVGKIVIGAYLEDDPERAAALAAGAPAGLDGAPASVAAEHKALGVDHAVVGEAVALRWDLPAEISTTARWHHDPSAAAVDPGVPPAIRPLVDVVHVADALAHANGFAAREGGAHRPLDEAVCARLRLDPAHLEAIAAAAVPAIEELARGASPAPPKARRRQS